MAFFACSVCSLTCNNRDELNEHYLIVHPKLFKQCPICRTVLRNWSGNLQRHLKKHKEGFVCNECKLPFETPAKLKRHEMIHTGGIFKCTEQNCTAIYSSKDALNLHLSKKHTGAFRCDKCPERFQQASLLISHYKRFHPEDRAFTCPIENCFETFNNDSNLSYHMHHRHATSKSVKCDYPFGCSEWFFSKSIMYEHKLQTHYPSGLICPKCEQKFDFCIDFDNHYQNNHATIDEKIAFSTEESNRWLYKLYFLKSIMDSTFKIGVTRRPLHKRMYDYKHKNYAHAIVHCWQLPLSVNTHRCYAHQIENKIHLEIVRMGFETVGDTHEFFKFKSSPEEETLLVTNLIDEQLSLSDFNEPLRLAVDNLFVKKLYFAYSESLQLGKIGFTTQSVKKRLHGINRETPGGNFINIDVIFVDPAATLYELKAWENDVLVRLHQCFPVMIKHEYFSCPPEDVDAAVGLFQHLPVTFNV
jgi:aspartate carbamoyltransferase regulatory subunit